MLMRQSSQVAGVDGCKAGWFVALVEAAAERSEPSGSCRFKATNVFVAADFTQVLAKTAGCDLVCVDIPIGLSDDAVPRQCDVEARRLLGPVRASSVFPAPVRSCLAAGEYAAANTISRGVSGRGLSRQSFAILPKIREVDEVMTSELQNRVREIHPEVCFCGLAGGTVIPYYKKSVPGQIYRYKLLENVFDNMEGILAEGPARGCEMDDALDALVAAWTAAQAVIGRAATLPENPPFDSKGLRVEMLYPVT
jgi:predicted RNase H-like nuclease